MTQRIHDRLKGEFSLDNEILVNALRTGKYIDQFTTHRATPEETQATLERVPKCMQMSKTGTTKKCVKCKNFKQLLEFSKSKKMKDGLQSYCRMCQKIFRVKYRKTEKGKATQKRYAQSEKGKAARKDFFVFNSNHKKATHAVSNAIRAGRLPRPDTLLCHYCPEQAQQYHHHNGYAPKYWLDVVPVCAKCHHKCKRRIV